jgi:hypothetical protein
MMTGAELLCIATDNITLQSRTMQEISTVTLYNTRTVTSITAVFFFREKNLTITTTHS